MREKEESGAKNKRIKELIDKDDLRELLFRYAECVDKKKWPEWEDCFAENAQVVMPFASHSGRAGLAEWGKAALAPFEITEHLYGNIQVRIDGDQATGRCNFWGAHTHSRKDISRHFDEGGSYSYQFVRTKAGWRISRLDLDITWKTGDDNTGLAG